MPIIQSPVQDSPAVNAEDGLLTLPYRALISALVVQLNSKSQVGVTASRPTTNLYVGWGPYWDTTLNKPVWVVSLSPVVWVDGIGNIS